jgi:hypothetical protein
MRNTEHSARLWMMIAFIAGIIFTAVLAHTLYTMRNNSNNIKHELFTPSSSEDNESLTPGTIPDDGYLVNGHIYRLVYACPRAGGFNI